MSDRTLVYLSHWRIPSEKTMSPLIMRTCAEFARLGYRVELWVPYRRGVPYVADAFAHHHIAPVFPLRRLPALDSIAILGKVGFVLLLLTFNWSAFVHLIVRRLKGERFIIYTHDMRDVVLPSLLREPLFVEIHDYYESSLRRLNAFVLRHTTGLIVTNTIKMRHLTQRYGFLNDRMIHQPNAVDAEMFDISVSKEDARRALGLPLDRTIALYTGHLFPWKGVYTLAEAAYHLEGTYIYFVGGTDRDRESLKAYVEERALPRIEFIPHVDHKQIPLFLKAADVLVLPNTGKDDASKYETSPVKLFEYMASGTPIVATRLPSILELISDEYAHLVQSDNPEAMAKAIEETITQRDTSRSALVKEWAHRHTWSQRAKNIQGLIGRASESLATEHRERIVEGKRT